MTGLVPERDRLLTATVMLYVLAVFLVSALPGLSRIVHVSVGLMMLALVLRSGRTPLRVRWDPLLAVFWLFTAFAFASVLWSIQHGDAMVSGVGLVIDVAAATLLWLALQNGVRLRDVGVAAAIGASVQALVALNQYFTVGMARSEGLTGNANSLAIQLSATAFLLLLANRGERWAQVLALALIVTATLTSGSRKLVFAWLSYSLVMFQALGVRLRRSSLTRALLLISLPLLAFVFVSFGDRLIAPFQEIEMVQRIQGTFQGRETNKRTNLMEDALERWWERPVVGYGIDQYRYLSPYATYSHNNFTELLTNFGVIGLILFYTVHIVLFARAARGALQGDQTSWIVIAILVMTVLMDLARVAYGGRLTWSTFAILAYATSMLPVRERPPAAAPRPALDA